MDKTFIKKICENCGQVLEIKTEKCDRVNFCPNCGSPNLKFDFDMDAFIQCAEEYGAIVSKAPEGKEGGIYVNGKPFTVEDFMSCFEEGPEDEQEI